MTKQTVNLSSPNDHAGDDLRSGGDKINDNFDELYGLLMVDMTSSEALAAGDFVSIHASSGAKIRKADADDDTKPVHGWVPASITNGGTGTMIMPGAHITGLTGLTAGATYYLSTTAGTITDTAPSSGGNLVQEVGVATSTTTLLFNPRMGITL